MGEILVGTNINDLRIYRSPDGGETWIRSDSGMGFLYPKYILMNSKGYLFTNGYGSGTYRSTTNVMTWEELPGIGGYNQTSCLHIKENDFLYVGISDTPPYRLVKSTDDGETWIDISQGIESTVEAMTNIGDTLYIGTISNGFYRSTDDGETWINLPTPYTWIRVLTKNEAGELFASDVSHGVMKFTDGGISWVDINSEIARCHTILPDVMGYFYVAGISEIQRSSDGGNSWLNIDKGIHSDFGESFYIAESGTFYFSTYDAGIFRSNDQGKSWQQVGFNNSHIYDITFDELENIYAATHNKIYKSTDHGYSWTFSGNGMSSFTDVLHHANNGNLWTGNAHSSTYHLYYSSDKGINWISIQGFEGVYDIDDNSSGEVYVGAYGGLYVTSDNGINWILKKSGSAGEIFIDDNDDIYFGLHNLELSTDNGETWTTLLTDYLIKDIFVDKKGNIFVGCNYDGCGLLRSTDRGISWYTVSHDFVGDRIYAIAGNSTNQLFCSAGKYGVREVYMSDDFGENWSIITSGIPSNTICLALEFDSRGFIYAGTTHNSIFRSLSTTLDIKYGESRLPSEYSIYQNYPNPFNPTTTIRYELPQDGIVTIDIYDILGQKVKTILNEFKRADRYDVTFNSTGLASGVYIYRIKVNDFITSKKMVLLK